jgi:hypothetical protein
MRHPKELRDQEEQKRDCLQHGHELQYHEGEEVYKEEVLPKHFSNLALNEMGILGNSQSHRLKAGNLTCRMSEHLINLDRIESNTHSQESEVASRDTHDH